MARRGPLGQRGRLEPQRGSHPSCASPRSGPHAARRPEAKSGRAGGAVRGAGRAPRHALGRRAEPDPPPGVGAAVRPVPAETAAPQSLGASGRGRLASSARKSPPWGSSSQRVSSKVSARAQLWREPLFSPGGDPLRRCLPSAERSPWLPSYSSSGVSTSALPCGMRGTVTVPTTATLADAPVTKRRPTGFPRDVCQHGYLRLHGAGAVRWETASPAPCRFIPEPALGALPPPPIC